MSVCVYVNTSAGTPWASVTAPVFAAYCVRHGYTLILRDMPYDDVLANQHEIADLLDVFDLVWTVDADCLITAPESRIDDVPGLGPHVSVCEEGMPWLAWNRINCGSMVYRATDEARRFLAAVRLAEPDWRDASRYPFVSQSWISEHAEAFGPVLTILPPGAFNSVAWEQHGGGTTWQPGHLVFHPCCHPKERRAEILRAKLAEVHA